MNLEAHTIHANASVFRLLISPVDSTQITIDSFPPSWIDETNIRVTSSSGTASAYDLDLDRWVKPTEQPSISWENGDNDNYDDTQIAAMSPQEIADAIRSMFGKWANRDDITDDWVSEMRRGWNGRLMDLYGNDTD